MKADEFEMLAGQWPGVTHEIKWVDDLVLSVAGKMFAVLCISGKNQGQLGFKVKPERFLELTDQPGVIPAPYLARAHWVALLHPDQWPKAELQKMLRHSYDLVKQKLTKKIQASL